MGMYEIECEGEDVSIVQYTREYSKMYLDVTDKQIQKYGLPRGLKYKGCDVIIPIPTSRSMKSTEKRLIEDEKKLHPGLEECKLKKYLSNQMAIKFFK